MIKKYYYSLDNVSPERKKWDDWIRELNIDEDEYLFQIVDTDEVVDKIIDIFHDHLSYSALEAFGILWRLLEDGEDLRLAT